MDKPTCSSCPYSGEASYNSAFILCYALSPLHRALTDRSREFPKTMIGCILHPDWDQYLNERLAQRRSS